MEDVKSFLTVDELAERLKVHKSWLYARTRERGPNTIPRVRVGKYIRFNFDEVVQWIKSKNEQI
jgi:excisionase family DNA binding protein